MMNHQTRTMNASDSHSHTLDEFSPEDQLILLAARKDLSPDVERRMVQLLQSDLDWERFLNQVLAHRVYPLVYRTLRRCSSDLIPSPILSRLKSETYQNGARNLLYKQELLRLVERFYRDGIPAIPYKGPVLAETLYGDVTLRVSCDLDFLIRGEDVPKVKGLLLALDYWPQFAMNPAEERIYLRSNCELNFIRRSEDGMAFQVELHWNILPPTMIAGLDPELIWRDASPTAFDGVSIYRMSPEMQFLALCLHAWKHLWASLQWICDVNEFLRQYGQRLDWSLIDARARALGIIDVVGVSLRLVERLFGGEPLRSPTISALMEHDALLEIVRRWGFPRHRMPSSNVEIHRAYLAFIRPWRNRWRYVVWTLMTPSPTDFQELRLPTWLAPFYWLLRPLRIVWKVMRGRQRM